MHILRANSALSKLVLRHGRVPSIFPARKDGATCHAFLTIILSRRLNPLLLLLLTFFFNLQMRERQDVRWEVAEQQQPFFFFFSFFAADVRKILVILGGSSCMQQQKQLKFSAPSCGGPGRGSECGTGNEGVISLSLSFSLVPRLYYHVSCTIQATLISGFTKKKKNLMFLTR